ncbi:GspE/PulE family protein [Acinetobacter nectaris]|uniref:GspE/PulE family protein n=1 Tax=Acinetobacter nectaris TaxID=1219382 RepID=UPI001F3AA41D|nr:GspE/PulE family protein [Acinetobacter nectaris]MCF8999486.1 type II/IV secretion system protein [Acinetobacter nectaris]MCF9028014.1 type II/IV secretion system protein [Acinetobacter nectaris]
MYSRSSAHHYSYLIDLQWCLENLMQDGLMSERDKILIQTTHRKREQLSLHPLQWIAEFNLPNKLNINQKLNLTVLGQWLANKAGVGLFTIDPLKSDVDSLTKIMSEEFAVHNRLLAVDVSDTEVVIGTDQPFMTDWLKSLEQIVKPKQIRRVFVNPDQLQRYLIEYYQVSRAVFSSEKNKKNDNKSVESLLQIGDMQTQNPDANDQHIVKLVDWILQFAFEQGASDIHLEPRKEKGKVRFRIDGVLTTIYQMPANTLNAVIARIKILGRMNVAEKRKPQDGRLKTRTPRGVETELRLSTLPTALGEKMVLRVFDPEVLVRDFKQLGFNEKLLDDWKTLTSNTHGIILVTGPTGSGKTTTLYSSLKKLATDDVNVCTIEDPIEMQEDSFNQMQVNANIDLGFADGIRALMRQDPDIIMIGEIRDKDTADMAIQAALTGHLVLSTLHTNDAPSSLVRLHDLGVQPFLSSATLLGVLAQRLVRRLCHCKKEMVVFQQEWEQLTAGYDLPVPHKLYEPVGCEECRHTGYKGRIGLYEFMPMSLVLKQLVSDGAKLADVKAQAKKEGVEPLRIAGARQILLGTTSIEEVLRVVPLN